jgi:hypothetical protein
MQTIARHEKSVNPLNAADLSWSDRRLLLTCTLRLFLRRLQRGHAVTSRDLVNLAPYGDDSPTGDAAHEAGA